MAAEYGGRLRAEARKRQIGRITVGRLLEEWIGRPVTKSKARKVWDLVKRDHGIKTKQEISDKDAGPLDRVISSKGHRVRSLDDLLRACQVDRSKWKVKSYRVNTWEQSQKTKSGPIVVPLFQVRAELERRLSPIAEPVRVKISGKSPKQKRSECRRILILPDPQLGTKWHLPKFDQLDFLHDPLACDLAVQVCEQMGLGPNDAIVCLGDLLDLPGFSRFPIDSSLRQTTAPTLAAAGFWLARIRKAAKDTPFYIIEGNHDARLIRKVQDALPEAETLTANGDDLPALDIRRLLNLDELGIEWVGSPYDRSFMLWKRIRFMHGSLVRNKSGGTVAALAQSGVSDTVCGHIHRREQCSRVVYGASEDGPRVLQFLSPGTLASVRGDVPGRTMEPNWHQGLGFGYLHGDHLSLHSIPIIDGRCIFEGRLLEGQDQRDALAAATGWHQFRKKGKT